MKKTIICFGDSNTHGYDTATDGRFDEGTRYTGLLATLLGDAYQIHEEGLGGRTACFDDPLTEGLSGLQLITPLLMTHEPVDLLLIMLGTNDTKQRFGATPENIATGISRLIRKAKDTSGAWRTAPNILLICPPPIEPGYQSAAFAGEMGVGCDEKARQLAPLYQRVAEELHCAFLDAGTIDGVRMHPHDCMHLTAESHRLLAEAIARMIPDLC